MGGGVRQAFRLARANVAGAVAARPAAVLVLSVCGGVCAMLAGMGHSWRRVFKVSADRVAWAGWCVSNQPAFTTVFPATAFESEGDRTRGYQFYL